MKNHRNILRPLAVLAVVAAGLSFFSARAVTDKEMEQARAITAQAYLRYANDGSGYLDDLKPASSVAELEKNLKAKEKENIKAFKSVAVPRDYASWTKEQLVEYWSVTFFKSSALTDKGKAARGRVKKKVSAMKVSAPAAAPKDAKADAAKADAAKTDAAKADAAKPDVAKADASKAAADTASLEIPGAEEIIAEVAEVSDSIPTVALEELPHEKKKSSGTTWIYIVALLVLVGVVVWLVIFASKTMQGGGLPKTSKKEEEGEIPSDATYLAAEDHMARRERHELPAPRREAALELAEPRESGRRADFDDEMAPPAGIAAGSAEIAAMEREIHDLRDECLRLGEENGRLTSDLAEARREVEALRGRLRAASAMTSAASAVPARQRQAAPRSAAPSAPAREEREIYLGRVNAKGLFVRADKQPVAEKSVFVLLTQDGYTGSFRVIQTTEVISMALDNPEYYLAGGCVGRDLGDSDAAEGIKTLQAGTAIFESGCWRVLRKAKIEYT